MDRYLSILARSAPRCRVFHLCGPIAAFTPTPHIRDEQRAPERVRMEEFLPMTRRDDKDDQPELISLARASRRAGLSVQTAVKLPPEEWPQ